MKTRALRSLCFAASVGWFAFCAGAPGAAREAAPFPLPATFTGTTPCADCAGIDVTLTLAAGGTYAERNAYRGRSSAFEDSGIWRYEYSSGALILSGAHGSTTYYRVARGDVLEQLDGNGDPIAGGRFRLTRSARVIALSAPQSLGLASTAWSILTLGGEKLSLPADAKTPSLNFEAAAKRVSGSSGCNNFTGSYAQNGRALKFSPLATTRMACAPPLDAIETRFLAALTKTRAFRIAGTVLELRDGASVLATFRAVR